MSSAANGNAGGRTRLSEAQQAHLRALSVRVQRPARAVIYREEDPADWVYFVGAGVVKAYRHLAGGRRRIAAFLFPDDIFGLAERGRYLNTTQAVTPVTLHRVGYQTLIEAVRHDAELSLQLLRKLAHELRESERRSLMLARRDARGRVAMFLSLLEHANHHRRRHIDLPMSRADIADYLALTTEAVSRATSALRQDGLVEFEGLHTAYVRDRRGFEQLVRGL